MKLLNEPTKEQLKVIRAELNEDELRFENNVNLLKKWYSCQDHLPQNYDDRIIANFLRGCKHDVERTKRKLEIYFSVRKNIPEFYSNRDPTGSDHVTSTRLINIVPLPNLTEDGYRVTIHKLTMADASLFSVLDMIRQAFAIGDVRVVEECAIAGDIFVFDGGNNITAAHCAKLATVLTKKALTVAHEAYPQRLKQVHVLNFPDLAEKLISLVKSCMKEKLRERFIVHKNSGELRKYIPASVLPEEYGGAAGDMASLHEHWQKYLCEKKGWFRQQEHVMAKGARPAHLNNVSCLDLDDCIHGSFRKLAID